MMRKLLVIGLLLGALIVIVHGGQSQSEENVIKSKSAVVLDTVDGLSGEGTIHAGQPVTLYFRFINKSGLNVTGLSHGLKIYSPDGATWGGARADTTDKMGKLVFDGGVFFNPMNVDGKAVDTIGMGAFRIQKSGLKDGYDEVTMYLTIGPIPESAIGKTICVDSTFFPPGGAWLWSLEKQRNTYPSWDGPHCFKVTK
jgi:hypothetical protein